MGIKVRNYLQSERVDLLLQKGVALGAGAELRASTLLAVKGFHL